MEEVNIALAELGRADVAQMRLSGLILSLLIERGILNAAQAAALVDNAKDALPLNHPHRPAYDALRNEFG